VSNGNILFRYYGNVLSMSQATATSDGYLSQVDWNRFNGAANAAVTSVFGRSGAVVAQAGDYALFYPSLTGRYANPAWITSLDYGKLTNAPIPLVFRDSLQSLAGTGPDLNSNVVTLVGDVPTPANSQYYGTNAAGTRGWFGLPISEPALGNPAANGYILSSTTLGVRSWIAPPIGNPGTVTSFSSGNLSPLFTTLVNNASSTPALSFTASLAAAGTVFCNPFGSASPGQFSASPRFTAINNLTANGFVKTSGSNGTLGVDTTLYEPALGNPASNGYVLSSTTAGVRSWIAPAGGTLTGVAAPITNTSGIVGLDQTAAYNWTGLHRWTQSAGAPTPIKIIADATVNDVIEFRNSTDTGSYFSLSQSGLYFTGSMLCNVYRNTTNTGPFIQIVGANRITLDGAAGQVFATVASTVGTQPNTFFSNLAGNIALAVQGAASQTADLQEWQDSTGASLASINSAGVFTGTLLGRTDGSAPGAGIVGQVIRATLARASQIALAAGAFVNVLSISLPAGEWDVRGNVIFSMAVAANGISLLVADISTTSVTIADDGTQSYGVAINNAVGTQSFIASVALPNRRLSLTATTTVYLVAQSALLSNGSGYIEARRM
jgi:hypothetical protein